MRGRFCRAVWGEGAPPSARQRGSVDGRAVVWRARPHPVATLTEATAQHGSYGVIPIRYVAGADDGRTYALDVFRLHWNMAWRDDDEPKRHSKLAKSPPALLPTVQPSGEGELFRIGYKSAFRRSVLGRASWRGTIWAAVGSRPN